MASRNQTLALCLSHVEQVIEKSRICFNCAAWRNAMLVLLVWITTPPVLAADWLMLVGTEEGRPEQPFHPFGFFQLALEKQIGATPVEGLSSESLQEFNGELASFNDLEEPYELSLRRARVGARGIVPGTGKRINFLVSAEAGFNSATRDVGIVLMDASVTLNYIPGLRVRVGQMKLPTMDEAIEVNPLAHESVRFSPLVSQLLLEQPIFSGRLTGPSYALRDLGIMAFDTFLFHEDQIALSYAAMFSQGHKGGVDIDEGKELTGRLQLSWLPDGQVLEPFRDEVSIFGWWLEGQREVEEQNVRRVRRGFGALVAGWGIRSRIEFLQAEGMIPLGATPPFAGQPFQLAEEATAFGWAFHSEVELAEHIALDIGMDELYRQWDEPAAARRLRFVSLGTMIHIAPRVRFVAEYVWRTLQAPEASADVKAIAETYSDLASAQLTVMF